MTQFRNTLKDRAEILRSQNLSVKSNPFEVWRYFFSTEISASKKTLIESPELKLTEKSVLKNATDDRKKETSMGRAFNNNHISSSRYNYNNNISAVYINSSTNVDINDTTAATITAAATTAAATITAAATTITAAATTATTTAANTKKQINTDNVNDTSTNGSHQPYHNQQQNLQRWSLNQVQRKQNVAKFALLMTQTALTHRKQLQQHPFLGVLRCTIQLTTTAASIVNDYSLSFKIHHDYRTEMSIINSTEYVKVLAIFEDGLMTSCKEVLKETFKGIDRNYRLSQGSVKIESVLSVFGNDTSLVEDKTAWENSLSSTLPGLFINGTFDYLAVGVSCGILFAVGIILFIILLCLYLHRKKLKDQKDIPKSECEIYVRSITGPHDQKSSKRLWMHNNSTGLYRSTEDVCGDVSTAAANGAVTGKSIALERIDEGGPHAPTSDSDSDYDGDQSDPVPLHRRQKDDVIVNLTAQSLNGKMANERSNKKWNQPERASHARDNPAFEPNHDDSLDNIRSYRPHILSQQITECTESTTALEDVSVALSSNHKQQAPRVNLVKPYNRDNDVEDNRNYYSQFRKPTDNSSQHVEAPAHINHTTKQSQQRPTNPTQVLNTLTLRNEMDMYRKDLYKPVDFGGPCIPGSNTSLQNNSSIGSRLSHAEPSAPDIDLKQVSPLDELFSNNKEQSFKSTLTAKARKLLGKNSNDILYRTNGNA
ncbi:hypothetical protein HELRODRAFT_167053 [Helobdella robusta]|uniref:Uncharacterized protein n=1 Tax=Helobdella robusta TaxID=6412 RepID=T1EYY3_HELRO|nr:hypothetical protein HELRODRAFT_167053 [Helobdella robusta]ESO10551.1 hypothetical protein HELRODRAFT_167053 [Helobdella robusta]